MKYLLSTLLVLLCCNLSATEIHQNKELAALFGDMRVTGTFVLYDAEQDLLTVHNLDRAKTQFFPASTFKIPNSLIGLSVGAVSSVDEILPYGGKPQPIKTWERDMGLREAITRSNVAIYQELARRIGLKEMRSYVRKLQYGNVDIGKQVDNFWLVGPLKISAIEQTRFLAQLAKKQLPLSNDVQSIVHEITLFEQGEGWQLHAKTGWASAISPGIGWWVGWVVKDGKVFSFALNIDINTDTDAAKRIPLAKTCLKFLGVLP